MDIVDNLRDIILNGRTSGGIPDEFGFCGSRGKSVINYSIYT